MPIFLLSYSIQSLSRSSDGPKLSPRTNAVIGKKDECEKGFFLVLHNKDFTHSQCSFQMPLDNCQVHLLNNRYLLLKQHQYNGMMMAVVKLCCLFASISIFETTPKCTDELLSEGSSFASIYFKSLSFYKKCVTLITIVPTADDNDGAVVRMSLNEQRQMLDQQQQQQQQQQQEQPNRLSFEGLKSCIYIYIYIYIYIFVLVSIFIDSSVL
jgi:hypothetical protein